MARQARLVVAGVVALTLACAGCSKKVAVPNVVDQDVEQAKQALAAAGLKPGNITGFFQLSSRLANRSAERGARLEQEQCDRCRKYVANSGDEGSVCQTIDDEAIWGAKGDDAVAGAQYSRASWNVDHTDGVNAS